MQIFEIIIAMLLVGAMLATLGRKLGMPYPALVALAGAGLALVPGLPTITLDPELALTLFVAPVLVDAAFDTSARDLRANWRAVTSLALGAVILTIAVVACIAKWIVPDMPWGAAIALGAIVAPPDAAAATTVLKQLNPPHRLMVILEGESLFNDASALLVYRLAVGATVAGLFSGWSVVPTLLIVTIGSTVLGLILARVTVVLLGRMRDVSTAIVFQFTWCFGMWMLAEALHLSGLITLVVFAMSASRLSEGKMPARLRIPIWAIWEVVVFILNVLAFILVGFQLKGIIERVGGSMMGDYVTIAGLITVAVILARIAWVTGAAWFSRWRCRPREDGAPGPKDTVALSAKAAAVVAWCGMRGTVTLAAALALPVASANGPAFPYRDLIIFSAFGVVLGTLVIQGLTLRPLMLKFRLEDDGTVDREVRHARVEGMRAAVAATSAVGGGTAVAMVRERFALQLKRAEDAHRDGRHITEVASAASDGDGVAVHAAFGAMRARLNQLRTDGTIGDAAYQKLQEELDWSEMGWAQVVGDED
jgi:Na+/H+ antiporter